MPTTKDDIRRWFKYGKKNKATHLIVVCDTFDYNDYPVYVSKTDNVHTKHAEYNGKNMQKVMEVYNLSMPMDKQINEHRSLNY